MDFGVFGLVFAFLITPIILSVLAGAALAWCAVQKIRNSGSFTEQGAYKYFISSLILLVANVVGLFLVYGLVRSVPTISLGRSFPSLLIYVWLPINLLAVYKIPAAMRRHTR